MPSWYGNITKAYPRTEQVMMDLLGDIAPVRIVVPEDFQPPLIVARRTGGGPDADDITDYPLVLISCYGATYPDAAALADSVQIRVINSPMTIVGGILIDEAEIYVGEQEIPDIYPDDRRISTTYRFGWRRQ